MDDIFITTIYIPRVCFIILFAVLVGYLLSLERKSPTTRWLIAFCCLFCTLDIGWDIFYLIPLTRMSTRALHLMFILGQGLSIPAGLSYLQFAYAFRGSPYPRESRVMLVISAVLAALVLSVVLFTPAYVTSPLLLVIQAGALFIMLLLTLWAGVVFLRKAHHFSREAIASGTGPSAETGSRWWRSLRAPQGRSAQACRAFAGVSLMLLVILLGGTLVWVLGVFEEIGIQLYWGGYILFLYTLLVVYVNYAPEPTTVQAKLVGAALATLLLFVVVLTRTVFIEADLLQESGIKSPPPQTLLFEPEGGGRYVVTAHPPRFEAAVGSPLTLTDSRQQAVRLPFTFPYYEAAWDTLYISKNGLISLGGLVEENIGAGTWSIFHTWPVISPLGIDLDTDQGGGVYYLAAEDSAVVTWDNLPLSGSTDRHTAQLVLYPTGAMAFHYGEPGLGAVGTELVRLGVRGLLPGGERPPVQALPSVLKGPVRSAAGAALIEDYATQLYRYQERKGLPLFILVVSASLFILLVFPYVFRYSLLNPLGRLLAGVQRVERGDKDTVVVVDVEDEIGTLTHHFNHMAQVIREAEQQLQAYAETLEQKVEARTAELAQRLEELRATQAQLIQAEKMASLGALTAGIAHEIKNPLNFVNNFAQLATEVTDDLAKEIAAHQHHLPAKVVEGLQEMLGDLQINTEKIEAHGRRADGIVQSMMQHAQSGEGKRSATIVNVFVEEYVNLANHSKQARLPGLAVQIERDLGEDVGSVVMVPQEMGRVLLNLLGNAFDAVQEGESERKGEREHGVTTATGTPKGHTAYALPITPPIVRVSTRRVGNHVEIRVSDNGPGIPAEIRQKIFEPFFTTKPTGTGTGLGLSMSYDIVTQGHGGTLAVESTEGEGATFIISLPQGRSTSGNGGT